MESFQIDNETGAIPENAVLIDLREEEDYAAGHIPGAQRIPAGSLREEIRRIARFNTPILLYCYTGKKSGPAAEMLQSRGYVNARSIGGIEAYTGRLEPELTVRELRAKKGLSQAALARMIGVRQPTVAAYEAGKAYPGPAIRDAIRRLLFVTLVPPAAETSEDGGARKGRKKASAGKKTVQVQTVREVRKAHHLTQAEFARSLGICAGSIAAYEGGRTKPGPKVIAKIREVYGAEVSAAAPEKRAAKKKGGAADE